MTSASCSVVIPTWCLPWKRFAASSPVLSTSRSQAGLVRAGFASLALSFRGATTWAPTTTRHAATTLNYTLV